MTAVTATASAHACDLGQLDVERPARDQRPPKTHKLMRRMVARAEQRFKEDKEWYPDKIYYFSYLDYMFKPHFPTEHTNQPDHTDIDDDGFDGFDDLAYSCPHA